MTLGPESLDRAQNRTKKLGKPSPGILPGAPAKFERWIILSQRPVRIGRETIPALRFVKITDYTRWKQLDEIARRERAGMTTMPERWVPDAKVPGHIEE
jgi:hypothetical protein